MSQDKPIQVFFSYAHEDEDLRDELAKHLSNLERQGVISAWYDRQIRPGSEWADEIDENLETAQIVLLLVSADFIASDYCYGVEMTQALERHEAGEAQVIPIILRDVDWQGAPFSKLQALPKNAKPVTSWDNQDEAFADVARGIRRAIRHFKEQTAPVKPPDRDAPKPAQVEEVIEGEGAGQAEDEGKPSFSIKSIPMIIWVAFIGIFAIIIVAMIYFWGILPGIQTKKTQTAEASLVAYATTETAPTITTPEVTTAMFTDSEPTESATEILFTNPIDTPTLTTTPTETPTPTATPTSTATEEPQPEIILESPEDGDRILRKERISVVYHNLTPGWTIHIIKQPLSQGRTKYPDEHFFEVINPSGEWETEVAFGQGQELAEKEEYNIKLILATDDNTRTTLVDAVDTGLDDLPETEYQFPTTTVTRGKYQASIIFPYVWKSLVSINSISSNREDITDMEDSQELFSSDQKQTTEQTKKAKVKLSLDGKKIAFISSIRDENDDDLSAIYLKDLWSSDEKELIVTALDEETSFSSLAWSPDDRYIVYTVRKGNSWYLSLYDVQSGEPVSLTDNLEDGGLRQDPDPSWIDTSTILYADRINGTSGFMSMDIATGETRTFFNTDADEYQGAISPDGKYLAYQVRETEDTEILYKVFVADLGNPESVPRLLVEEGLPKLPLWDPDGETIYYLSSGSIFAVDAVDKDDNPRLVLSPEQSDKPVWNMDIGYLFIDE